MEYENASSRACNKWNGKAGCLSQCFTPQEAFKFMRLCRHEILPLNHIDKKNYLREKIRSFEIDESKRVDEHGNPYYFIKNWVAGIKPENVPISVCKECFCRCYDIGRTYLTVIMKSIKDNAITTAALVNDSYCMPYSDLEKVIKEMANYKKENKMKVQESNSKNETAPQNITTANTRRDNSETMTFEERRALLSLSARTPGGIECLNWMKEHFDTVGEISPNCDEIHLDPNEKYDTYKLYTVDCECEPFIVSQRVFLQIWRECFPHVRLRHYKAVCGKCYTCARLSLLGTQTKTKEAKDELRKLWSFHKITFMQERQAYAARKALSKFQDQYVSIVIDGMAQNHMMLPWYGNKAQSTEHLKQKMNGVLCHGREFVGYRCYNNIRTGANFTIHCILCMLERVLKSSKKQEALPDTIFIQFDGASENANAYVLAMCELLITYGLTKKVVVTRLMVGHTHCDADGIFGILWKRLWREIILTPQQYKEAIEDALESLPVPACVEDVFVVPDYVSWLKPHIDPKLSCLFKEENTQLQFTFEATDDLTMFPNGVKMHYRAFSSDQVYELFQNQNELLGIEAVLTDVGTFPEQGMFVLQSLPDNSGGLQPAPFVEGSFEELIKVTSYLRNEFEGKYGTCVHQWEEFLQHCPCSDDSQEFVNRRPASFKIPFHARLFLNAQNNWSTIPPVTSVPRKLGRSRTTASVHWSNRGEPIEYPPPREYFDPESGEVIPLTSTNSDELVELSVDHMTKKQLMDKCKELGLGTSASNKAELVKRIKEVSIQGVRGYSTDKYMCVALSMKQTKELRDLAISTNNYDALPDLIKSCIVRPDSKWKLEMRVKHSNEFYKTVNPDGTCGFMMDYLMTTIRYHMSVEEKNGMSTEVSYVDINNKEIRQRVYEYALSMRDSETINMRAYDNHNYVTDWKRRINGFVDFLAHYRDSGDRLSDAGLWFSTQSLDLFRFNDLTPYSLFIHNPLDDPIYSLLLQDTRFMNKCGVFTYSELLSMVTTCNFAVLSGKHYYPYRAYAKLCDRLDEAIDSLCLSVSKFMKSSPLIAPATEKSEKAKVLKGEKKHRAKLMVMDDIEFSCGESDSDYEVAPAGYPTVDCLYSSSKDDDFEYVPEETVNANGNDQDCNDVLKDIRVMTLSCENGTSSVKRKPKKMEEPTRKKKQVEEAKQVVSRELRSLLQDCIPSKPHRKSFVSAKSALKQKVASNDGEVNKREYHSQPGLLYNEYVCRRMLDFNGTEDDFLGEIVAGGFDKASKTWRVQYQEINNYVEELTLDEILESLV